MYRTEALLLCLNNNADLLSSRACFLSLFLYYYYCYDYCILSFLALPFITLCCPFYPFFCFFLFFMCRSWFYFIPLSQIPLSPVFLFIAFFFFYLHSISFFLLNPLYTHFSPLRYPPLCLISTSIHVYFIGVHLLKEQWIKCSNVWFQYTCNAKYRHTPLHIFIFYFY